MEQYLTHTDHALWEVIVNGDAPTVIASVSGGAKAAIPPKTTEQKIARTNELKVKSTLLLAIPDENLLKFHEIKDAKTCKSEVYEAEIKIQSSSSSNSQSVAFVSSDNTSSTNEVVNIAHDVSAASSQGQAFASTYADDVMFSFFANQSNSLQVENEDLEQINTDDLEKMNLKWQGYRNEDNTRRVVPVETPANALVVADVMGYDWSYQAEEGPTDFALMAHLSSGSSSSDTE
nr:hypothetical protein [Tanacetum cinerariifolium]